MSGRPWERYQQAPSDQGGRSNRPWERYRQEPQRQQSRPEVAARSAVDAATLGRSDEWAGAFARFGEGDILGGLDAINRNMPFNSLVSDPWLLRMVNPEGYERWQQRRAEARDNDAYRRGDEAERRVTQQVRTDLRQGQEQHPWSALGGTFAGGLALGPLIPSAPALGYVGRVGTGMAAGAAGGAAYGYNSGTDPESRAEGARSGAGWGALFGGAFPAAAGPLGRAMNIRDPGRAIAATAGLGAAGGAGIGAGAAALTGGDGEQVRDWATMGAIGGGLLGGGAVAASRMRPQPNTLSMSIGAPTGSMGGPGGRPSPEVEMMARQVQRARLTPEEIGRRLDEAAADPRGRVLADVLGESAQYRAGTIARMPGQTRGIAGERMSERFVTQGRRLAERIAGPRAANELNVDAVEVLAQRVTQASDEALVPLLRNVTPEGQQQAAMALDTLAQRPSVRTALQTADEIIAEDVAAGRLPPAMAQNAVQRLHTLKIVLQAQAADPTTLSRNAAARIDNMALTTAAQAASQAIESAAPGYAQVMEQLQSVIVPREIMRIISNAQRGDEVNVARAALRNLQVRDAIQDPRFARIGQELRTERDLYDSGMQMAPDTGSPTAPRLADMMDQVASETPPQSATDLLARMARAATAGFREDYRNRAGRALFAPVDSGLSDYNPQEIEALRRALINELRRRREATRNAAVGGFTGGIGGGAANE